MLVLVFKGSDERGHYRWVRKELHCYVHDLLVDCAASPRRRQGSLSRRQLRGGALQPSIARTKDRIWRRHYWGRMCAAAQRIARAIRIEMYAKNALVAERNWNADLAQQVRTITGDILVYSTAVTHSNTVEGRRHAQFFLYRSMIRRRLLRARHRRSSHAVFALDLTHARRAAERQELERIIPPGAREFVSNVLRQKMEAQARVQFL